MYEGKDEGIDNGAPATIQIPQLSADISVTTKAGQFTFRPTRDITAYQLALVMQLCFSCINLRVCYAIDDAFAEVYAETAEQWEKVR